jgi:uncharacterized protein
MDEVIKRFLGILKALSVWEHIIEIYLFGSRCRDDWRPDSDYDLLIVLDRKDRQIISSLYDAVLDILLETGKLVSLKIFESREFQRLSSIPTPFIESVLTEGVKLAGRNA